MKKRLFTVLCLTFLLATLLGAFVACDDSSQPPTQNTSETYSVKTEKPDAFADYYTIYADKSLTSANKTVTVTVDAWDFLKVEKVLANDTVCTPANDGEYTFAMPSEDVTVHAEFDINIIPEGENGLKWLNYDDITTSTDLSGGIYVDFGSEQIINSSYANPEGYSTMTYAKVFSSNQQVVPDEAIRRIEAQAGNNGAYAVGALISFDMTKVSEGKTTLVFIDTDNDRAISVEINVVK